MARGYQRKANGGKRRTVRLLCGKTIRGPRERIGRAITCHKKVCERCRDVNYSQLVHGDYGTDGMNITDFRGGVNYQEGAGCHVVKVNIDGSTSHIQTDIKNSQEARECMMKADGTEFPGGVEVEPKMSKGQKKKAQKARAKARAEAEGH